MSCSDSWCLKLVREVRVSSFIPVIGSRELEGKAAKGRFGFGGDKRDIPAGVRATGGCYYGDL